MLFIGFPSGSAAAAKSLQSCPILCDPIDGSPPGSPISGILQAKTLEWVAISFSNAGKGKVKGKSLRHVQLFLTPWTAAYQVLPSMGFSRQEYWSGEPLSSLLWWLSGKEFAGNAGDQSSIPASGRSSGEGSKNPLQYSCLGNNTDREACHKRVGHD